MKKYKIRAGFNNWVEITALSIKCAIRKFKKLFLRLFFKNEKTITAKGVESGWLELVKVPV